MSEILTSIAGVLSGLLGAMGLGGGGILIIYLSLFTDTPQATAQGINLIFFIPSALIAVFVYFKKKLISLKVAVISSVLGVVGAFFGTKLSYMLDDNILSKLFGILLLIMGLSQLFSKKESK